MSESRSCRNCGAKEDADGTPLKNCKSLCGHCLKMRYCSVPCQQIDRDRHRSECHDLAKANERQLPGETKSGDAALAPVEHVVIPAAEGHGEVTSQLLLSGSD